MEPKSTRQPQPFELPKKLHAYTLPRQGAANTRVRDLVDMVLLIQSGTLGRNKISQAIRITSERRKIHTLPDALPLPPAEWQKPYEDTRSRIRPIRDRLRMRSRSCEYLRNQSWAIKRFPPPPARREWVIGCPSIPRSARRLWGRVGPPVIESCCLRKAKSRGGRTLQRICEPLLGEWL